MPLTRFWLIPPISRPKVYIEHPLMNGEEIRRRTQVVWDRFYALPTTWKRSRGAAVSLKARLAFMLISKIYRQMYANTGMATDSARLDRSVQWTRLMAIPCRRLFAGRLMPELQVPAPVSGDSSTLRVTASSRI